MIETLDSVNQLNDYDIAWLPNLGSQMLFLSCPHHEVFYGGTRYVGKTDCLLMDFYQEVGKGFGSDWRGIIFRRTYKQLHDLVVKSKKWFSRIEPKATFNKTDRCWEFPGGELLYLSYFDIPSDYDNYHGHSYPWIGWEELLNWPDLECYSSMMSCNRATAEGVPVRIRSTGNPWGIGRSAVKGYFMDPAPWGTPIENDQGIVRVAICGNMIENVPGMKADPTYRKRMLSMPDKELIKAWVFGRWDVKIGGFFSDVWDDKKNIIPISKCFTPPPHWYCFRSFDWGSASPFSVGWWCESDGTEAPNGITYPRGALIRFAEWYGNDKNNTNPNTGLKITNEQIGRGIIDREKQWPSIKINKGPADTQIFEERGGPSIARQMGFNLFKPADKSRIPGWQQVRERMQGIEDKGPLLYIMEWCKDFTRSVPYLQRDDKKLEDIADQQEDHIADESRYACMWRRRQIAQDSKFELSDILIT